MKKLIFGIISVMMIMGLFLACSNSAGDNDKPEDKTDKPVINRNFGVKFNFTGAQALAKLETKTNRAVVDADDLGDLVKILADGSMENAITIDTNCSLSDIVAIYKSPLDDSKDIFIVLNGKSVLGYEEVEKEYEWGGTYTDRQEIRVGQLICLHEDGSVADILKKENPTEYWDTHMSLKTDSVTFDAKGNLYFISSDNGDMIYQFYPKTNELTTMVAAVEKTYYEGMQIDNDGKWIIVSGSRYSSSSSYFLRAIPIINPNSPVNIYYSSTYDIGSDKWAYDDKNGIIYFIVSDGGREGLFRATKSNGFKDKEYVHQYVGSDFDDNIFNCCQAYVTSNFADDFYKTDGELDTASLLEHLFSFCNIEGTKEFRLTEFRNDEQYGSLYSLLKNEEALEWIAADTERLNLFSNYCGLYPSGYYFDGEEWIYDVRDTYFSFMNMLSKTCFISGTSEKAITWNCENKDDVSEIPYYCWESGSKLSVSDSGVYYEYYDLCDIGISNPYYYIVQVADEHGKIVELVNKLPLPAGKVVRSEKNKDRLILQYSITNESDSELGYHHIYAVGMGNGEVKNCFDNVPNHNSLEVVSFNTADDLLYYSAVRGTSVENGIVNIVTNEYNPLTVQRKMVAVYTFN